MVWSSPSWLGQWSDTDKSIILALTPAYLYGPSYTSSHLRKHDLRVLFTKISPHTSCPQVSVSMTKHQDQKASWWRKGLFNLYFNIAVHHWGMSGLEHKQRRISESGADAEAIEGNCSWFASLGLLGLLSYSIQEWHDSPWTGPSPIDH